MSHPIHRRLLAEQLLGLRRSTEGRRYASAQRSGRIDANPHQIDAVIFALGRVREGGCILADEVGLGKTIEAGLVMAQLRAEGASRILLVAPKALLGQWRDELFSLFGISVVDPSARAGDANPFDGAGVFLVGRDALGSERALEQMRASGPFDLCVVDEAHEIFAGIYRRFDRAGQYLDDSPHARIAGRLRALLGGHTPVLLLTATPLQNSLAELWGLVQYVDRSGTLLGDLPTFRQLFCSDDDRMLVSGQEEDLQRRMQVVIRRTLRRQAQEFMKTPFVGRRARLFEYDMTPEERSLYDDVTRYLLTPGIAAFRGRHRRLLVIGFHRRMASSHRALSQSLGRVAERLRALLAGDEPPEVLELYGDLEEADEVAPTDTEEGPPPDAAGVAAELALVESFIARLGALGTDGKALALVEAVRVASEGQGSNGSGKLVIFTESLATQDYLRELLVASGWVRDAEITSFRGQNTSARAAEALATWEAEVGQHLGARGRPARDVAMRLALVHEFKHRSRVLIATEAGAKGLNLQFCDTVINYDLPWNPQRIEQRIGRCHRYGQTRDVTVINFIARDNAAQRLTFEILSRKLELFGAVLDASDQVLHEPNGRSSGRALAALSADFANELRRIYQSARSLEQIEQELARLGDTLDRSRAEVESMHQRTVGIIESRFDEAVRQAFRQIAEELPVHLARLDEDLERFVTDYLDSIDVRHRRCGQAPHALLEIAPDERLPEGLRAGARIALGGARGLGEGEGLGVSHPLVRLAAKAAREATQRPFRIRMGSADRSPEVERLRGRRGRLTVLRLRYPGFEPVDRLLPVALLEDESGGLDPALVLRLLQGALEPADEVTSRVEPSDLEEAVEESLFLDEREVSRLEHAAFERAIVQLERFIEDRVSIARRARGELARRIVATRRERDSAAGSDARGRAEALLERSERELERLEAELARLLARDDDGYRRWRQRAYERRYAPPERETLLHAEFEIG
jgi:helicase-like protein/SNF2 domain-containing protein